MYLSVGMNNNKAQKYSNQSHEKVWLLQINAIGFLAAKYFNSHIPFMFKLQFSIQGVQKFNWVSAICIKQTTIVIL